MHRQIILDTETTGLDTTRNHKIIEIGCIEIVDRKYTGKDFHFYLNPKRKIDQESENVTPAKKSLVFLKGRCL